MTDDIYKRYKEFYDDAESRVVVGMMLTETEPLDTILGRAYFWTSQGKVEGTVKSNPLVDKVVSPDNQVFYWVHLTQPRTWFEPIESSDLSFLQGDFNSFDEIHVYEGWARLVDSAYNYCYTPKDYAGFRGEYKLYWVGQQVTNDQLAVAQAKVEFWQQEVNKLKGRLEFMERELDQVTEEFKGLQQIKGVIKTHE